MTAGHTTRPHHLCSSVTPRPPCPSQSLPAHPLPQHPSILPPVIYPEKCTKPPVRDPAAGPACPEHIRLLSYGGNTAYRSPYHLIIKMHIDRLLRAKCLPPAIMFAVIDMQKKTLCTSSPGPYCASRSYQLLHHQTTPVRPVKQGKHPSPPIACSSSPPSACSTCVIDRARGKERAGREPSLRKARRSREKSRHCLLFLFCLPAVRAALTVGQRARARLPARRHGNGMTGNEREILQDSNSNTPATPPRPAGMARVKATAAGLGDGMVRARSKWERWSRNAHAFSRIASGA